MNKNIVLFLAVLFCSPVLAAVSGIDTDGGFFPLSPGFVVGYDSPDCSGPEVSIRYDECGGESLLEAMGTATCGKQIQIKEVHCESVCERAATCMHTYIEDHWGKVNENKPVGYCACLHEVIPTIQVVPKWQVSLSSDTRTKLEFELVHKGKSFQAPVNFGFNVRVLPWKHFDALKFYASKTSKSRLFTATKHIILVKKGESKGEIWMESNSEAPISNLEIQIRSADSRRKIPMVQTSGEIVE